MNTPLWFSNLSFWSAQVAVLALAAGFLPRLLQLRQPRVLLAYWRALLAVAFLLPVIQPWHRMPSFGAIAVAPEAGERRRNPIVHPRRLTLEFPQLGTHRPDSRCRDSRGNRCRDSLSSRSAF